MCIYIYMYIYIFLYIYMGYMHLSVDYMNIVHTYISRSNYQHSDAVKMNLSDKIICSDSLSSFACYSAFDMCGSVYM